MTLSSIKVGDIVHVDKKGRRFYAEVTNVEDRLYAVGTPMVIAAPKERKRTVLAIRPLCRETYRQAEAREVIGHYRKAKGSQ